MAKETEGEGRVRDGDALQDYILLVLSDSNLPTGGFVASAGLESFWAHGLLARLDHVGDPSEQLVAFVRSSVTTYAHTVAGYLLDAHRCTRHFIQHHDTVEEDVLEQISTLDQALHVMTLNHVTQRASKAQGVALLTLYAKSFAPSKPSNEEGRDVSQLIREMKKRIRAGTMHGHLATCWAVFMAALGVESGERALAMHLFLQARSILSAAVRLNVVGPYQSHRLLAFDVKRIIADVVQQTCSHTTQLLDAHATAHLTSDTADDFAWTWQDDGTWSAAYELAPKTTWPLGDLLQARHDQLHSRLFNS